jgi:hypothetical protein
MTIRLTTMIMLLCLGLAGCDLFPTKDESATTQLKQATKSCEMVVATNIVTESKL